MKNVLCKKILSLTFLKLKTSLKTEIYQTVLFAQMKQLSLKHNNAFQFSEHVSMFQTSSAIMNVQ